ncbi:MAG: TetR family transcriptional regulator [Colwelliaceae bacterium]|nr:TetR family transcriptional regulator [Colwelliaceae bacterium]
MVKNRSKNEVKRQQILDAATALFTEQGYIATSMMKIASVADVSKQTVYSHFGSKEELFSAAITHKCDSALGLTLASTELAEPRKALLAIGQKFFEMITSKEALAVHKICAFESRSYPELSELFYQAAPQRLLTEMTKLMEQFDQSGVLSIPSAKFAAVQFLNVVKGEAFMRIEFNTKKQLPQSEIDAYIENSVDFFLRGYQAN